MGCRAVVTAKTIYGHGHKIYRLLSYTVCLGVFGCVELSSIGQQSQALGRQMKLDGHGLDRKVNLKIKM